MADVTYYVALPFVVSYDGSAPGGVVTIGDFAARRIDLDLTCLVDLRQPCSLDLVCGLPISRLGLIDKVLAPASVKERPVPQWQRQKAKGKVERINPNCQRKDCRSIRRSFCLGGALAFGGRCLR